MESAGRLAGNTEEKMLAFDIHCDVLFLYLAVVSMLSVCFCFNEDINFHLVRCVGHFLSVQAH